MTDGERSLADSYTLLAELGRGGMGHVFRARERTTGVVRAVKILDATLRRGGLDRFRREAQALARVGKGVVPVHAFGVDKGRAWYAMDLLPGGSLEGRLKVRGPLEWREAAIMGA